MFCIYSIIEAYQTKQNIKFVSGMTLLKQYQISEPTFPNLELIAIN